MIGFLVKKTFFDVWDNMIRIVLLNMGFILSLVIPIILPGFIPVPLLAIVVAAAGYLWCTVYLAAAALSVRALSDYGIFSFADFVTNLKKGWPAGIIIGLTGFFFFVAVKIIIPFYLQMNSLIGLLLGAVIFWTLMLVLVAFQFFFAIRARLDSKLLKIIKKCFIIFFDNPGFSIFILLYTIVTLVISVVFAFLIPGPAGILLFLDEALRLRLMKYDWLEANPPAVGSPKRQAIPWDAILIEEREKTGTRTFRNFIFPWKD
ncbi:MAG: hypothetical protein LBH20_03435 [Treponema sp.]|jgi:hypothetical protein|nr:hypothetical protein [Treponema sp.]